MQRVSSEKRRSFANTEMLEKNNLVGMFYTVLSRSLPASPHCLPFYFEFVCIIFCTLSNRPRQREPLHSDAELCAVCGPQQYN